MPIKFEEVPPKYVVIDGVREFNPEYEAYLKAQEQPVTTALYPEKALPVVCNLADHKELKKVADKNEFELAKSAVVSIGMLEKPVIYKQVGLAPEAILDELGAVFARHEIPLGMMNNLFGLSEFELLEFIIDDSGSMGSTANPKTKETRWQEARTRLKEMIEIMAYVPTPKMKISFLNRINEIELERKGETPEKFIAKANALINEAFLKAPAGGTPVLRCLQDSLKRSDGKSVARYLFCDGLPSGGERDVTVIGSMLLKRPNPAGNPFTFISCSDNDDDVKWMKEAEEVAPACSEYDSFEDEAREVAKDQGTVFPYTKGMHLVGQLVGAMSPNDLDALDESVPFTKWTLDNLLGVISSEEDYRRYFDGFKEAQDRRKVETPMDGIKKRQQWEKFYNDFLGTRFSKDIQAVKEFKTKLEAAEKEEGKTE